MRKLHKLQNRREYECQCGDEATQTCYSCGERLCRDCKLDHECIESEEKCDKKTIRDNKRK